VAFSLGGWDHVEAENPSHVLGMQLLKTKSKKRKVNRNERKVFFPSFLLLSFVGI